jgi:hypothetical protein
MSQLVFANVGPARLRCISAERRLVRLDSDRFAQMSFGQRRPERGCQILLFASLAVSTAITFASSPNSSLWRHALRCETPETSEMPPKEAVPEPVAPVADS